jgi:hypothetical protein
MRKHCSGCVADGGRRCGWTFLEQKATAVTGAIEHWHEMRRGGLEHSAFSASCTLRAGARPRLLDLLGNRGYRFLPNTGER